MSCVRAALLAAVITSPGPLFADDWPQWLGPDRAGVWRETGLLEKFPEGGPPVKWRAPVAEGYSGPAVAGGKVFVTDWVREPNAKPPASAFERGEVPGKERVLCLDAATGQKLWEHAYPTRYRVSYAAGPRATPTVVGNRVFVLGCMGNLLALDVTTGKPLWQRNFVADYQAPVPVWGFAAHPLVDGDRVITLVGGEGSLVVAFHIDTGKEIWKALSDEEPGYCPPVIVDVGGKRQLIIWHPSAVTSLDPANGNRFWSQPFRVKRGLTIPTPRVDGDRLFVTAFYDGSLMLNLAKDKAVASLVWRAGGKSERPDATRALHSIMTTPVLRNNHIYGVDSYGELRCLEAATGDRVWSSLAATTGKLERWGHAFLIPQGERYVLFNEKGDLILANLTPKGYQELSRANILEPTNHLAGRPVVWTHPAFAGKCVYARNDKELVCVDLSAK